MQRVLTILFFIFFYQNSAFSNHIVGGEIEMIHIGDSNSFTYEIKLIQYFDAAQDENPGPDNFITYSIFRLSDGTFMQDGTMPITKQELVPYTDPDCSRGDLITIRVEYSHEITLDPNLYNDPQGYMIAWERCCRNQRIKNLTDPGWNGMKYILQFPPIVDESGAPFINSSPKLFPPLSDYACVNQLFYIDFAGTDDDGDEIIYSLSAPLDDRWDNSYTKQQIGDLGVCNPNSGNFNGPLCSSLVVPDPLPPPHNIVQFSPGYTVDNMIPGNPPLSISNDGFITVTPEEPGLYVFSVTAEEYRNGIKIGEAKRDFQMLVVPGCNPPDPPETLVKIPGQSDYYNEDDTIYYVASEPKCFELFVTDDVGTNVTLSAEAVSFAGGINNDISNIFSFKNGTINSSQDTISVEVCVSDCPYVKNEPFLIDLIASDDACPLPQKDTVRVTILVEPPTNKDPYFFNQNDTNYVTVQWNSSYSTEIIGLDEDLDSLNVDYFVPNTLGFDIEDYGISFSSLESEAGSISSFLNFDTNCRKFDYSDRSNFLLGFVVDDLDTCNLNNADTIFYDLTIELPENTGPILSSDKEITDSVKSRPNFSRIEYETDLTGSLSLNLFSDDTDNDSLIINALGVGFDLNDINGLFSANNFERGHVEGQFNIDLECINFPYKDKNEYRINFITEDIDYCQEKNADTIQLVLKLNIPDNIDPKINNETEYVLNTNNAFEVNINGTDADNDLILLELISDGLPGDFKFESSTGVGEVNSKLYWNPTCEFLGTDFGPKGYNLTFRVKDNNCPYYGETTKTIKFLLEKPEVDWDSFIPPNAFSPNGDGINDVFKLTNLNIPNQNLPVDGCDDNFESIIFVDRTGVEVYKTNDKYFEWDGGNRSPGVYFYYIKYTISEYKGSVTIVY